MPTIISRSELVYRAISENTRRDESGIGSKHIPRVMSAADNNFELSLVIRDWDHRYRHPEWCYWSTFSSTLRLLHLLQAHQTVMDTGDTDMCDGKCFGMSSIWLVKSFKLLRFAGSHGSSLSCEFRQGRREDTSCQSQTRS
jgi:hypothetical protein